MRSQNFQTEKRCELIYVLKDNFGCCKENIGGTLETCYETTAEVQARDWWESVRIKDGSEDGQTEMVQKYIF